MKPEDAHAEAVRAVAEALYRAYDSEFNASHLSWQDFAGQARELIEVASPHIERQVRAKIADDLKRVAAGRRDYATRAPDHLAAELEGEARVFESAAQVATAPRDIMWGLLPASMWIDADRPAKRGGA